MAVEHFPGEPVTVFGRSGKLVGRSGTQGWWVQFEGENVSKEFLNAEIRSLNSPSTAEEAYTAWSVDADNEDATEKDAFLAGFEAGKNF